MQNFIIVITYKDGTIENIPAYCTIEQASQAVQAYSAMSTVESVYLKYK